MEVREQITEISRPRLAGEIYDLDQLYIEAQWLIDNRSEITHDNWEKQPEINARTALFEALTAKGHLSRVEFPGAIEDVNQKTLVRLINGFSHSSPIWEQERRHLEVVEELLIHKVYEDIKTGLLPEDTIVITISNFPEEAAEDEAVRTGYSVLNHKGMARTTDFENGIRTLEQSSRSNSNDGSGEKFFASQGFVIGRGTTRLLANQIIATKRDFPDGAVDIQRALDSFSGPNVIYGEDRFQTDLNVPEYEELREVSRSREEQAESFIKELADFERQLDVQYKANQISYSQKLSALNKRRKELVAEICLLEPGYAKDAMGEASAGYIKQASYAMAAGNDTAGMEHMQNALAAADPRAGAVCGGSGEPNQLTQNANSSRAKRLFLEAKEERKNWRWQRGTCAVKECPTRPAKTDVGPCSVCRNCQTIFDKGDKPSSIYKVMGFMDSLFESIAEFNRDYKAKQEADKLKKAA